MELRLILAPLLASSSRVETFRDAALYLRLCISGSTDPSSLFSVHEAGIYMEKGKYILVLCDLNIHVGTYVRFVKKKKEEKGYSRVTRSSCTKSRTYTCVHDDRGSRNG